MDTSPTKRRETPDFYGFVPPTGRGLIFMLMVVNSTSQFLAKIMAIALLGAVSKTWVVAYLLGDMCLYLLYKLLRNDFFYYIPVESYFWSIALSLGHRMLFEKVRSSVKELMISLFPSNRSKRYSHTKTTDNRRLYGSAAIQKQF